MHRIFRNISLFSTKKFQQYLKLMQVSKTTNQKQLKIKFIKLAKKYHPDSGSIKDPSRFKSILEAYRFLSKEQNWPSNNTSSNTTSQSFANNQKPQSKQQRNRRQTYSYFNQKYKGQRTVGDMGSMGYDSFYQTLKAAPELKVFTLGFIGLGIMIWIFMITGMNRKVGPHKTEIQKIFYSKEEQKEYKEKQKKRKERKNRVKKTEEQEQREYFKKFNFSSKFDDKKNKSVDSEQGDN